MRRIVSQGNMQDRRGFVLLTASLVAVGVMLFLGLAFDAGYLEWVRVRAQAAADAAALGAATELAKGSGRPEVVSAGKDDSSLNGFTDGANDVRVTINNPPVTGSYAGKATAAEAIVSEQAPLTFMRLVGMSNATVTARAVGVARPAAGCVYVLDPAGAKDPREPAASCGVISPGPDPLAYLTPPKYSGCDYVNYSQTGAFAVTMNPGVYCGGITLDGTGDVTFAAGTYVLTGSTGFNVKGAVNISQSGATGVTFYNTGTGAISLTGASNVSLSAPSSGPLAGILFYQDAADTAAASIQGAGSAYFVGALYFPSAALSYAGSSNKQYTILVSRKLAFTGPVTIGNDYSALAGGSPIKGGGPMLGE